MSRLAVGVLALAAVLVSGSQILVAQTDFSFYTQYPALIIGEDQEVSLYLELKDLGQEAVDVILDVSGPEDWNPRFETSSYPTMEIKAVHLLPDQKEPLKIRFKAKPPKDAGSGDYKFVLTASTPDGAAKHSLEVTVTLKAKKEEAGEEEKKEALELLVDYPTLENAAGKDFVYTIQIKNQTDKDQMVDMSADLPTAWRAYFTPRWQESTHITSIKVNAHSTENVRFVVTPPYGVDKGDYPIKFVAKAGDQEASLDLKAVVTGTYELGLASEAEITGSGDTWNIKAVEGKERIFTLYLYNKGSSPITNIKFYATKPQGWKVEFKPDTLKSLPPTLSASDLGKVEVVITPPARAIPGDYQISITASGEEDHKSAQLRVTVGASMGWGWIGVGVVVFVVAGLTGVFVRLGRR